MLARLHMADVFSPVTNSSTASARHLRRSDIASAAGTSATNHKRINQNIQRNPQVIPPVRAIAERPEANEEYEAPIVSPAIGDAAAAHHCRRVPRSCVPLRHGSNQIGVRKTSQMPGDHYVDPPRSA